MDVRIQRLPGRRVVRVVHPGTVEDLDATRRPLYQHLIQHEAVGGPSMVRFPSGAPDDAAPEKVDVGAPVDAQAARQDPQGVEVLVQAAPGFHGTDRFPVVELSGGVYAVTEYEGPEEGLPEARRRLLDWVERHGHAPVGGVVQVHLMDTIDGVTEQELQVRLADLSQDPTL